MSEKEELLKKLGFSDSYLSILAKYDTETDKNDYKEIKENYVLYDITDSDKLVINKIDNNSTSSYHIK